MDCQDVLDQLADYLDDDARIELCRQIEAHLAKCRNCQVEVDTVKKTIVLYQTGSRVEVPVRVSAELQAALSREYQRGAPRPTD